MPESNGFSSLISSKNSLRRPSRIEYVMASSTPASEKSGTTNGAAVTALGGATGFLAASLGGIERAGVKRIGRGEATCRVGIGDGIGVRLRFGLRTRCA